MSRRFPAPWKVLLGESCFEVQDATGFAIVRVYFEQRVIVGTGPDRLTLDEAHRIAINIAKLPEFVRRER